MSAYTGPGAMEVEVRLVPDPEGKPAILLQLPDGFVLMTRPGDARKVAGLLVAAASALEEEAQP